MSKRTVTLSSGYEIYNVPEDVTDEEIFAKYEEKEQAQASTIDEEVAVSMGQEEEEETSISDIGLDFAKVLASTGRSIAETTVKVLARPPMVDETYATRNKKISDRFDEATRLLAGAVPFFDESKILDEKGKLEETKTATGAVLEMAPYIAGATAFGGTKVVQSLASGVAVDQVLADPKENVFNVLQQYFPESTMAEVTEFLATDENDSEAMARLKLVGEGLTIGVLAEVVGGATKLAGKSRDLFRKPYTQLTEEEQGEVLVDYLKEAKETTGLRELNPKVKLSETAEGSAQVAMQYSSPIKRFAQQFFTSRGYFTPKAFNAFQDSENAQRATVAQAENISRRLQIALDNVADGIDSDEVANKVQEALTTDLKYTKGQSKEANVIDIMDQFDIPEEVASEVLKARELIDATSKKLVNSSAVPLGLKEVIAENSGSYLRRSYRLYEDTGYVPSSQVRRDAEQFLVDRVLKLNPNLTMLVILVYYDFQKEISY